MGVVGVVVWGWSFGGGAMAGVMDVAAWGWWYGGGLVLRVGLGVVVWGCW